MERSVGEVQDFTAPLGQHALATIDCCNEHAVLPTQLKVLAPSQACDVIGEKLVLAGLN
jgi:hypothetical protein